MDPPCVARENPSWSVRSCTNVSGLVLELMLRTIMEIRARPSSLAAMPRRAIRVISSRMRWKDHFSISCFSLADLGGQRIVALTSRFSLSRALRPDSRGLGRGLHRPDLEVATAMEDAPGDAGDFVGKRNRQLEAVEPLGCSLDPGFEAMLLPALRAK